MTGWRFSDRPWLAYAIVSLVLLVGLGWWVKASGRAVCEAPSVPVRRLDARLDSDACATIGWDRVVHGVWVDSSKASLFFPDATDLSPERLRHGESWLLIDPATRARIRHDLPASDDLMASQLIAISFYGTEYRLDRAMPGGLRRLFDARDVRSIRLIRRAYRSARTQAAH